MYLGIDLGTSAIKVVLVDDQQTVVDEASVALSVSRPQALWSEQDPAAWWQATDEAISSLANRRQTELQGVRGIGLSGQMHGATLLDADGKPLRPAILWNDGRSAEECKVLENREPASRKITGNLAMPGFTAPKLIWVEEHEPEVFRATRKVLLPKDYLRWRLSGVYASEMSDAAGTLWLDVGGRCWSGAMLAASHLDPDTMPALFEGSAATGTLRDDLARRWGMRSDVVIAGGGGDNAAGAVGVGIISPGQAFLSLGTSGVLFAVNESFSPNPERAAHAFCHAVPETWHQMSVILSAASCLSWACGALGYADEATLLDEVANSDAKGSVIFLPYLSGERTPHNDPHAKGGFLGMTHDTKRSDLARAVLEGVAFAFAEGQTVLQQAGAAIEQIAVIGGGARSRLWGEILASALDRSLDYPAAGEVGAAFGAARLGRLAATGEAPPDVCRRPEIRDSIEPNTTWADRYRDLQRLYTDSYRQLRETFPGFDRTN